MLTFTGTTHPRPPEGWGGTLTFTGTLHPRTPEGLGGMLTFTGTTHPRLLSLLAPGHKRCAMRSSLAPAHRHDATLSDLILAPGWGVRWGGCDNVRWLLAHGLFATL